MAMPPSDPDSLRDLLQTILKEYPKPANIYNTARNDDPNNYEISDWSTDYRRDLIVNRAKTILQSVPATTSYKFIPSKGQQNAPNIPYLAFVNRRETRSVQYGRDIVYLFDPINRTVYLTLNQGAAKGPEKLAERLDTDQTAESILQRLSVWYRQKLTIETEFTKAAADLHPDLRNSDLYNAGTIAYKEYTLEDFPDEETLQTDLEIAIEAYDRLLEDTSKLPPLAPASQVWQLSPEGGDIWPAWKAEGVASISSTFAPGDPGEQGDTLTKNDGTTIDDWNLQKDSKEGQAFQFQSQIQEGDTIIAATHGTSSRPHDVYGIGIVESTSVDSDEVSDDVDLAGHRNLIAVEWTAFDDGLVITLPIKSIPLTTNILTRITNQDALRILLESIIGQAYAGGLYPSEEAAITAIVELIGTGQEPILRDVASSTPTAPYYWVNQSNNPNELQYGYLQAPNDTAPSHDLAKLEEGDTIFHYQKGSIIGNSKVTQAAYRRFEFDEGNDEWEEKLRVDVDLTRFKPAVAFSDVFQYLVQPSVRLDEYYPTNQGGINQRYFFNLSEKAGDYLLKTAREDTIPRERLETRLELPTIDIELPDGLYFHKGEAPRLRRQINAALNAGKHIIFTGPPGTGKSRLAKSVAKQAPDEAVDEFIFTTATADWTTFDTVGGYVPDNTANGERLRFDPRLFLRCFRDSDDTIRNQWLIIDELNRANIDKALGQLFSVLSEDSVELPYERAHRISIDWVDQETDAAERHMIAEDPDRFPVTPAWRLIGTMNTYDKTSLYELSYAFMRRFSFIHVGVPELEQDDRVISRSLLDPSHSPNYATIWSHQSDELRSTIEDYHEQMAVLWGIINRHRTIGPAIVLDILRQISAFEGGDQTAALTAAVINLVFPQLEGMRQSEQEALLDDLAAGAQIESKADETESDTVNLDLDVEYLRKKASDIYEFE